jgi:maltose/moltooligosaccharide transporter
MGIINMMIVIPMLIQNLSFGYVLKHFLNNDPGKAISFAGVFLMIAAVLTFFIQTDKSKNTVVENAPMGSGH